MAAKRTSKRSSPWASLAKEIHLINPKTSLKEVDSQAWQIWFTAACPLTVEVLKDKPECLNELYEQSSGKFVEDDTTEGEPKED